MEISKVENFPCEECKHNKNHCSPAKLESKKVVAKQEGFGWDVPIKHLGVFVSFCDCTVYWELVIPLYSFNKILINVAIHSFIFCSGKFSVLVNFWMLEITVVQFLVKS